MARLMALSVPHRRMMATVLFVLSLLLVILTRRDRYRRSRVRRGPGRSLLDRFLRGEKARADFMFEATKFSDRSSLDLIRMTIPVFDRLCEVLVEEGGLRKTKNVEVDEMVVMFLHTLGHNAKNRILQKKFGRSGKTICAVIHAVLASILRMHRTLYRKAIPVPEHCPHVTWKHFKNCLGALDGTHVKVRVRQEDQPRYRSRNGEVSINVLGVCNPDMEFIYCLAGWEGSVHDERVLQDALSRPMGLRVPKGSYYLCDAGFANSEGFLTPFTGSIQPNTPEEYYNMNHSSAKNVIEKAFELLKMRWAILRDTTWFSPDIVARIVHACCLLHNFIKQEVGVDGLERSYIDLSATDPTSTTEQMEEFVSSMQPTPEWIHFRNQKAQEMWQNRSRQ
ncbi:Protein ALP1-like [Linum grandiflorum]